MPITEILKKLRSGQKTRRKTSDSQKAIYDQSEIRQSASCEPCIDAIIDVKNHYKHLTTNIEAIGKMREDRSSIITMEDGIRYTIDDINAKIYRNRCWIEYHLDRYEKCCKEGKLPETEKYRC